MNKMNNSQKGLVHNNNGLQNSKNVHWGLNLMFMLAGLMTGVQMTPESLSSTSFSSSSSSSSTSSSSSISSSSSTSSSSSSSTSRQSPSPQMRWRLGEAEPPSMHWGSDLLRRAPSLWQTPVLRLLPRSHGHPNAQILLWYGRSAIHSLIHPFIYHCERWRHELPNAQILLWYGRSAIYSLIHPFIYHRQRWKHELPYPQILLGC